MFKLEDKECSEPKIPEYAYNPSTFKVFAEHLLPMQVPGKYDLQKKLLLLFNLFFFKDIGTETPESSIFSQFITQARHLITQKINMPILMKTLMS